jgi:PhzF family phenazine biosynthesis protein
MRLNLYQVDAFTDRAFAGNPAAVCLLPEPRDERWMQDVAREMNLSETAFLVPREGGGFGLRWFTPALEVELCGHATLASAHVLWESGILAPGEEARFYTLSGWLTATQVDGDISGIMLDFPATPVTEAEPPPGLAEALGVELHFVGKSTFDYLVEIEPEAAVRRLTPDFRRLASIPVRGVIVTARASEPPYDFVSRFFAPGSGVDEDPVTGSAHCSLGPYWGALLGKDDLLALQASPRGGTLRVRLAGERVKLIGQAITVMEGQLLVG